MSTVTQSSVNKYKAKWTGKPPKLYLGEWKLYKNGEDVTFLLPTDLRTIPAFTYGEYPIWETVPYAYVQQFITDGYQIPEWIRKNLYWLNLVSDNEMDYLAIYNAFHEFDFRTTKYM